MSNDITQKDVKTLFQIVSLVLFIIIILFNVIGTIFSMYTYSQLPFHKGTDKDIVAKNMPYNSETSYDISREPVRPNDDIIIKDIDI